ncbi:MAG: prolipoprotein diacylglyceryl transferase [Oscillospiraceae bacterium]|nr:prolipoprotein diacylglyceryl transferase [Oscillospiraceae bacterium]
MNPIAISVGGVVLYWSSLLLCLGAAAWLTLALALYRTDGGPAGAVWVWFPFAVLFSVLLARFLHWYCHAEQYTGLLAAMTRYDGGGYCLPGLLLGTALAALLAVRLGFAPGAAGLLDALAPGAALCITLIRLGALFGSADRGKLLITKPVLQHLPFAAPVATASGAVEYRFATFFVEFLLLLALSLWLLRFYLRQRHAPMRGGRADGSVALLFLVLLSAVELVADSTRYDSSFLRSNGFVSLTQIVSAAAILAVLIYYVVRSVKARGFAPQHILLVLLWLAGLGATAYLEYLVQRHGDWYLFCYAMMSLSCAAMALAPCLAYRTLRVRSR